MECKPLNISVTLVSPGSIKSNIASNHEKVYSGLPENSLYRSYIPQIIERMTYSQRPEAMPTEEFAKQLVDKLIARTETGKGGEAIILGGDAAQYKWFLRWLPRRVLFWRTFSW